MTYTEELKHLTLKTRNRLRSVLALETREAIKRLNEIRRIGSAGELAQVDKVLWAMPSTDSPLIPDLFPNTAQTTENFVRLEKIDLHKQIRIIEIHAKNNRSKISEEIARTKAANTLIIQKRNAEAADHLHETINICGYSHLVLRKVALIRAMEPDLRNNAKVDAILVHAGLAKNNLITSSLVHCFQDEQDFLSIKRSIMNMPNKGAINQFTRDISRIPLHPHAKDEEEFCDHLQSTLQSSLIDALLTLKINKKLHSSDYPKTITEILAEIEESTPSLEEIARLQANTALEGDQIFYKRSGAWLEKDDVLNFRLLLDNFYDSPDASYINIDDALLHEVGGSASAKTLDDLATAQYLSNHKSEYLRELESSGSATRSALFNYCLHSTQGYTTVAEANLVNIMGRTRDLSKTIPSAYAANLAKILASDISRLILHLLIAKRSKNERDDHLLRKAVQDITIKRFSGKLTDLITHLESQSPEIATYAYDVFTEDFIAKLYNLIQSPAEVTDTRAALHRWMGQHTGDKAYIDRAHTILIDHQLNKVRNEIDDNRIYVDVARFNEWISEEIIRDLNTALSSIEHKGYEIHSTESVISILIDRCYNTFCSHRAFGISSYLGRRIRHGTFKGHLYSNVIRIASEPRFQKLISDPTTQQVWADWKRTYEEKIDRIIRERLHVASPAKREGLFKPSSVTPQKSEIILSCTKALIKDFIESKTTSSSGLIITEYCWRLAEVDLKAFNSFLKSQRESLVQGNELARVRDAAPEGYKDNANMFCRAITRDINERLMTMQMWFKRPVNVSPKASLQLLYKAVVEEVRETYPSLKKAEDMGEANDIELFGGAYHVLYDSFYVVVYNAAKHGKDGGKVEPRFSIVSNHRRQACVLIEISSELRDNEDESKVQERLKIQPDMDVDNAQTYENRSGIPKLYHLQSADNKFSIQDISCDGRRVTVSMTYVLDHL